MTTIELFMLLLGLASLVSLAVILISVIIFIFNPKYRKEMIEEFKR